MPAVATSLEAGTLTLDLLSEIRGGDERDHQDRARHNAVTNNSVNTLALNRDVVRGDDGHFSHRVKSKGITNQKKSGRCWMFAALNVVRPQVIRDHRMAEFEFSTSYLQFWDKLEKSNLYFESIIELRDADFLDREWEIVNKWTLSDGGWWNFVTGLIEKYGVVPASVMPETQSSENTTTMNHILERLVRTWAARILALHEQGKGTDALRAEKEEGLKEIYRFLSINLGEPPTEFEWRYRTRKKTDKQNSGSNDDELPEDPTETDLTPLVRYTPQSFYKDFVGVSLTDYVCLYNDPKNELNKHYTFERARNIVGTPCMNFVNIGSDVMKKIAADSIVANEPLWFAANMDYDQSVERGLMEHQLYDYESLFGIDLSLSKADRARFHLGVSNHAMALMGVDLVDGSPRKWLVENSWGDEKGAKGTWTLYNRWFDEHVYTIIVHKRHVPEDVMAHFQTPTKELPGWYPGAQGTTRS